METTKLQKDKSNYSVNEIKIGMRIRIGWIETITIEKSIDNIDFKLLLNLD